MKEDEIMRVAVISDIHSNKYALENSLKDIKQRNVDTIICTGDLVGYFAYPNEVIEMIKESMILTIKGNHDQVIAEASKITEIDLEGLSIEDIQKSASRMYTNLEITDKNRQWLERLPDSITLNSNGYEILFIHGSPTSNTEYMYEDNEILKKIGLTTSANIIVSGHTHLPHYTIVENKHYINPGSIGKPKHGNSNSSYVIIDISNVINCEFIEVKYNVEAMVEDINNNPMISDDLTTLLIEGK